MPLILHSTEYVFGYFNKAVCQQFSQQYTCELEVHRLVEVICKMFTVHMPHKHTAANLYTIFGFVSCQVTVNNT